MSKSEVLSSGAACRMQIQQGTGVEAIPSDPAGCGFFEGEGGCQRVNPGSSGPPTREICEDRKPDRQQVKSLPPREQTVYLHRDSKGRGGSTVTLVKKLVLSEQDMKELARKLKQVCGSGGTVKEDVIEIQGEHREKIAEALKKMGYKVKIAGG